MYFFLQLHNKLFLIIMINVLADNFIFGGMAKW